MAGIAIKLAPYIALLRPTQWLKNLMLLFPPFLGGMLFQHAMSSCWAIPVFSFCMASSATYVFNDILDAPRDLYHPVKRLRPIPSGAVTKVKATGLGLLLLAAGFISAFWVSYVFLLLLICYLIVSVAYCLKLKDYAILDIFCISSGFVIRLLAGGEAFRIPISEWLFLSVFLLALFLSIGKRLQEKVMLGDEAGMHRRSLATYPSGFLDGMLCMTGSAVLVTYSMYTLSRSYLFYTVPLCCFGLLRYILRVKSGQSGDPTESLLKDIPLLLVSLAWVAIIGWRLYF